MGTVFLSVVGLAITSTQISCSKTSAQTSNYVLPVATNSTLGGVIVGAGLSVNSSGVISTTPTSSGLTQIGKLLVVEMLPNYESAFYICNYDGSNKTMIPITLPVGRKFASSPTHGRLSPDGKILFFEVYESSTSNGFLYSCNVDGSNLKVIYTQSNGYPTVQGAY